MPALSVDTVTGWAVAWNERGDVGRIVRTTDGGTHWKDVTPISSLGRRLQYRGIASLTPLIAWTIRDGKPTVNGRRTTEILRTEDAGQTWGLVTIPAMLTQSLHFIDARHGWLLSYEGSGNDRSGVDTYAVDIYQSTDGGGIWIKVGGTEEKNGGRMGRKA